MCEIVSDAGLFTGLWHGLIALFALVVDIFWDVPMFDQCSNSWFYNFGFLLGVIAFGGLWFRFGIFVFFIVMIIAIIYFVLGLVIAVVLIGIVVLIIFALWDKVKEKLDIE